MPEPAKDTAIEITPKPRASSVPIPRIVAEINRVASRVRDRNKKEEEDIDDADVLENDEPAPSPKPADIQIIRENTHYRGKKRLNILLAFLLVLISVLLLAVCVFLARIDENIRLGGGANIQSLASPPPPSPYSPPPPPSSPPPPTVITPSSIASIEHKAVVWNDNVNSTTGYRVGLSNFKTVVENEGVSTTDLEVCATATLNFAWNTLSGPVKKCLMELLMSTLAKDNWALIMAHSHPSGQYSYDNAYYFTRTNYTTPTVAVSTVSAPAPVPAPSANVSMEHKAVFWSSVPDFKTSAENEGVSTTDMEACTTSTSNWYNLPSLEKKCLVELLLSTLEEENWTLTTHNAYNPYGDGWMIRDINAYHFTRPVQTS
ncbi:unnamed protein product [Bathycoccus prasinos]